eukprot:12706503-Alexandrium_andersonii.AAC.1
MCIRDSNGAFPRPGPEAAPRNIEGVGDVDGEPEHARVDEHGGAPPQPGREPAPRCGRGRGAEDEHPEVIALAPQYHDGELVLARGQLHLVESIGHVGAQDADLIDTVRPEE